MKIFIDELEHYSNLKKIANIVGKPCIWSILSILMETEHKTINITALISRLNSNYRTVSRCINYMKNLQIVEEVVIGRLRLIKLLDNQLTQSMLDIIRGLKDSNELLFSK